MLPAIVCGIAKVGRAGQLLAKFFFLRKLTRPRGLFLERPGIFSGPESCFVFVVFAFKINASIILKIIQ